MYDCSAQVTRFHNDKISLTTAERTLMRERRDANRDRIRRGLDRNFRLAPDAFHSQGSYAMKTMVQSSPEHVDIDDGIYFVREKLVAGDRSELSAAQVRQLIADAAKDPAFNKQPEIRETCVR